MLRAGDPALLRLFSPAIGAFIARFEERATAG
jgi:hypothetical protein